MLNEKQKEAVNFKDGACLVLAGPGSGKTTVITRRILSLIESGVKPDNILVITFTRAAAKEMQDRFLKLYPDGGAVNFGTFHSIFYHILAHECHYKAEDILKESTKHKILKDVLRKRDLRLEDEESLESILAAISRIKGLGIDIETMEAGDYSKLRLAGVEQADFSRIFTEYQSTLFKNHHIDFDDMVNRCYELFEDKPKVLKKYQEMFKYIMVDEAQDMSPLQYMVVKKLARPCNNLFLVGDDDQSIYGFRGSDPKILMSFNEDFEESTIIELSDNYRSCKDIVDKSKQLIGNNKSRFNKTQNAFRKDPAVIKLTQYNDEKDEARDIIRIIKEEVSKGIKYEEIAILYRNHSHALWVESLLTLEKIPSQIRQKKNKFEIEVVKDILSYISIARNEGKRADFFRVMNKPERGILRQALDVEYPTLRSLIEYYHGDSATIDSIIKWQMLNNNLIKLSASGALSLIGYGFGYEDYLKRSDNKAYEAFVRLKDEAESYSSIASFCRALSQKVEAKDEDDNKYEDSKEGVGLYTLHASKGLEFKVVLIIETNEGFIPQKQCASQALIEEERRLFYVGMTRAKDKLFISTTKKFKGRQMMPSRFLDEIK